MFGYLSDSVTQPAAITTPNSTRESRNLTNFSFDKDPFNSNLPLSEPLTPLESKLKDIIINVYCDTPSTPKAPINDTDDNCPSSEEEHERSPSLIPSSPLFPKHILSSSRMSLYSGTEDPPSVFNPIFSADDSLTDHPSTSISQFSTGGLHDAFSAISTVHNTVNPSTVLPRITPNDVYSPNDIHTVSSITPVKHITTSYFSSPADTSQTTRFPGFPERVTSNSPTHSVKESSNGNPPNGNPPNGDTPNSDTPSPVPSDCSHSPNIITPPKPPEHLRPCPPRLTIKEHENVSLSQVNGEAHPLVLHSVPQTLQSIVTSSISSVTSSVPSSITSSIPSSPMTSSITLLTTSSIPSSSMPYSAMTSSIPSSSIPSSSIPSSFIPSSSIPILTSSSMPIPSSSIPLMSLPMTSSIPSSLRPTLPSISSPWSRPLTHPYSLPSSRPLTHSSTPNQDDLRKQLKQLLKEKVNLEGQLESMVHECQLALQDRAQLQMQLSESKYKGSAEPIPPSVSMPAQPFKIDQLESSLRTKEQEKDALSSENKKLKQRIEEVYKELGKARQGMEEKNAKLHDLASENSSLSTENGKKQDAIEALGDQVAKLQASLESMESGKKWLHDQLQDAIQSKTKLQEELRGVKASSYTSGARLNQLEQENELLSEQVSKLQNKMFQDKASLVDNLEEIEADVLLREAVFAEMEDKHKQMEQMLQLKNDQMEDMREKGEKDRERVTDLELQLSDLNSSTQLQAMQVKNLEDEGNVLKQELQLLKATTKRKDEELDGARKDKTALQQQLKHVNTGLITKEGELQTLKDLSEINKEEVKHVNAALEKVEAECEATRKQLAERDNEATLMESKIKQLSSELAFMKQKLQNEETEVESAKSTILDKENEIEEKLKQIASMEADMSGIAADNESLHSQLQAAIEEATETKRKAENDAAQLVSEHNKMRANLSAAMADSTVLNDSLADLNKENERLRDQLQTMAENDVMADELRQALKKNKDLEVELEKLKNVHSMETHRDQAKITTMSEEIEQLKEECKNANKLQEEIESLKEEIANKKTSSPGLENKLSSEISSLQSLLNQRDNELMTTLQLKDQLNHELMNLKDQLVEEQDRISELEQESHDLTVKLQERENELNEEINELIVDNERLKGRLSGLDTAQKCLREHLRDIESSLADKESEFMDKLSKSEALVCEKEREIEQLESQVSDLQDTIDDWKAELEKVLTEKLLDKQRAESLERALQEKVTLNGQTKAKEDSSHLQDTLNDLEEEKRLLQSEVGTLKQNLSLLHTTHECTKRELEDKSSMASILTKKSELMEAQLLHANEEIAALENKLQAQLKKEMNALLTSHSSIPQHGGLSDREGVDGDLSSFNSDEDSSASYCGNDIHGMLQQAQLDEFKGKLVKARKEGEEVGQRRVYGEMKSLRHQLGARSKALRTLQDCVSSLKDDMTATQLQINTQVPGLTESFHSARNIEGKIDHLHQNQSTGYS